MDYNDENINLSNDWQEMAREYEQTLKTLNGLPDEVGVELNSVFHLLLTTYPNMEELKELDTAIKKINIPNKEIEIKKSFFSTPISLINKRIYALSNSLLLSLTSVNSENVKKILLSLFKIGQKINELKRRKW